MYLGEYRIDDYVTLVATTHRFSSGAAYAPTAITYRVYEDATNVEIVADTAMTNFDTETGFYLDRIQCTAALGYEINKTYTALIKATVDSVAAITVYTWRILTPPVNVTQVAGTAQTAGDLAAMITVVDDFVDAEVSAIKTKTDFLPSATAGAAGGLMIAGSNAATTFATLTVTGATIFTGNVSYQAGIVVTQSTANDYGLSITGNGIGAGVAFIGGTVNGEGLYVEGKGSAAGLYAVGGTNGDGFTAVKQGTGVPIRGNITGNITGNLSGSVNSVTTGVSLADGAITTLKFAAGAIDAAACAADFITSSELAASAAEKIADAILNRNVAGGSNTGRLVKEALYLLRNKAAIAAGTLTVYQTDDATAQWTAAVATTAGNPISSVDPV